MTPPKKPRKPHTERQRQAARDTVQRLMAEGRWGRPEGAGRKRHVRAVPRPRQLVGILEYVEKDRNVPHDATLRTLLKRARPLYALIDREEVAQLVTAAYGAAIDTGDLPEKAIIAKDGHIEFVKRGRGRRRPDLSGEQTVTLYDPRTSDWGGYSTAELLDVLCLFGNTRVWTSPQSQSALDFCLDFAASVAAVVEAELVVRGELPELHEHEAPVGSAWDEELRPLDTSARQEDGPPGSARDPEAVPVAPSRNGQVQG